MPTLHTERLTLRYPTLEDLPFVEELYSSWQVTQFLGAASQALADEDKLRERMETWEDEHRLGSYRFLVLNGELPLGIILLKPIPTSAGLDDLEDVEIGWHFHPNAWGKGYATEAAKAVLDWGFALGLERVVAVTRPENTASQAVCERLGMEHLGQSNAYYDVFAELFMMFAPKPAP